MILAPLIFSDFGFWNYLRINYPRGIRPHWACLVQLFSDQLF
jgi:hypothetical protein